MHARFDTVDFNFCFFILSSHRFISDFQIKLENRAIHETSPSPMHLHCVSQLLSSFHSVIDSLGRFCCTRHTHLAGCAFDESIVHHKSFKENPDYNKHSTQSLGSIVQTVGLTTSPTTYRMLVKEICCLLV